MTHSTESITSFESDFPFDFESGEFVDALGLLSAGLDFPSCFESSFPEPPSPPESDPLEEEEPESLSDPELFDDESLLLSLSDPDPELSESDTSPV
jgi:hypothetical protein